MLPPTTQMQKKRRTNETPTNADVQCQQPVLPEIAMAGVPTVATKMNAKKGQKILLLVLLRSKKTKWTAAVFH
jgi:hypothetical protein